MEEAREEHRLMVRLEIQEEGGKVDRRGNRRDENDLGVRMVPGVAIEKCKVVNRDFGKEMIRFW